MCFIRSRLVFLAPADLWLWFVPYILSVDIWRCWWVLMIFFREYLKILMSFCIYSTCTCECYYVWCLFFPLQVLGKIFEGIFIQKHNLSIWPVLVRIPLMLFSFVSCGTDDCFVHFIFHIMKKIGLFCEMHLYPPWFALFKLKFLLSLSLTQSTVNTLTHSQC